MKEVRKMKRFWIILLSTFLVTMGLFFLQSWLALKEDVEVEFKKVSGSDSELKNLLLYGTYQGKQKHLLKITDEKTIDIKTESFFYKLSKKNDKPSYILMEILKEQHPNFMVGKELFPNYFYEDEKLVVYSNIRRQSFRLEIKALNKKTDQITSIECDIPEKEKYERMSVDDVQVINGELKVITSGFLKDDRDVMCIYTFDINKQKLINNETIAMVQGRIILINNHTSIYPQKYLLIEKETYGSDPIIREYFFYNVENDQLKKWSGYSEIPDIIPHRISIYNSRIFFPSSSETDLKVSRYDIEKEEWDHTLTFNYGYIKEDYSDIPFQDDDVPYIQLMNGKLYVIRPTNNGDATIHIGDLNTGKLLYEGKLIVNRPLEERKGHHLSINQLGIVD